MDTILADNRAAFTERLDALLALKADEAFAGSCEPAVASDRRAVFRQARLDFIARFQPDDGSPPAEPTPDERKRRYGRQIMAECDCPHSDTCEENGYCLAYGERT
jgi:hypothetical protein